MNYGKFLADYFLGSCLLVPDNGFPCSCHFAAPAEGVALDYDGRVVETQVIRQGNLKRKYQGVGNIFEKYSIFHLHLLGRHYKRSAV